mmetsp:Transcript_33716/g.62322  ORF Transcript_33716/g.62322 Transcript_33716/m.62322 type:complete len:84 (+) Transcript_33716:563-814(+)
MHADDFVINDSTARKTIESVTEVFPQLDREAPATFVVKSIYAIDTRAFVVSAENEEVFWVLNFVSKKETHNLKRLLPAIDVVS